MCSPQTLGHLEKAVVLELTLKHVKALTSLLEQQQQKILALQNGMQIGELQVSHVHVYRHTNLHVEQDGFVGQNANPGGECRVTGLCRSYRQIRDFKYSHSCQERD